jgi:hypothetical protein
MTMKKAMDSEGMIVVGKSEEHKLFPVGFEWRLGSTIYTVKEVVAKDPHSDMRRVVTSAGDEEYMTSETIKRDLKDSDAHIISEGVKAAETDAKEETKEEEKKDE